MRPPLLMNHHMKGFSILLMATALMSLGNGFAAEPTQDRAASGAQCRFADGSKAVLVKPDGSNTYTILIRSAEGVSDLSTMQISPNGQKALETNGGITKQLAVERIFHKLQKWKMTHF